MRFGEFLLAEAVGGILAHAVTAEELVLRKGSVLSWRDIDALAAAGVAKVTVALLEAGDLDEDTAAARVAVAVAGEGVRVERPATGRVNLHAETAGVLCLDHAAIDALNRVDEAITVATLPAFRAVVAGEMVATVKIIPFGVPAATVEHAIAGVEGAVRVAPYRAKRVALVSTLLPGLKPSVVDKTVRVLRERLAPAGAALVRDVRVPHQTGALVEALRALSADEADLMIVFGAAAITDRRDTVPAALVGAGGRVKHLGMPVDPGNLLLLGELHGRPFLGAPGCARSPKENGFDWVLQRLLADVPVTPSDIQAMGVGGLLMEIVSRPRPREPGNADAPPVVAAVVLAAGRSTRMGDVNKLLAEWHGKPLVRHAVEAALASHASPVLVVTGHEAEVVEAVLSGLDVRFVRNPDHAQGLSTSVCAGIAALPAQAAGVVVLPGDMPLVQPQTIDRLIAAFADRPDASAAVPTLAGRRGNPVLLSRQLFPVVTAQTGDVGARGLLDAAGEALIEVPIDDDSVAFDIDTPEALANLRAR